MKKSCENEIEKTCERKIWFVAKYNSGSERIIDFKMAEDGSLLWGGYYVDTLMESAEDYLSGEAILCVDGGSGLSMVNISEWVKFVLANRHDIDRYLRKGFENINAMSLLPILKRAKEMVDEIGIGQLAECEKEIIESFMEVQ